MASAPEPPPNSSTRLDDRKDDGMETDIPAATDDATTAALALAELGKEAKGVRVDIKSSPADSPPIMSQPVEEAPQAEDLPPPTASPTNEAPVAAASLVLQPCAFSAVDAPVNEMDQHDERLAIDAAEGLPAVAPKRCTETHAAGVQQRSAEAMTGPMNRVAADAPVDRKPDGRKPVYRDKKRKKIDWTSDDHEKWKWLWENKKRISVNAFGKWERKNVRRSCNARYSWGQLKDGPNWPREKLLQYYDEHKDLAGNSSMNLTKPRGDKSKKATPSAKRVKAGVETLAADVDSDGGAEAEDADSDGDDAEDEDRDRDRDSDSDSDSDDDDSESGSRHKRSVTGLDKKKVAADQEWDCGHCKMRLDETYEVDHIKALRNGGDNSLENLVALCRNCHGKKTAADEREAQARKEEERLKTKAKKHLAKWKSYTRRLMKNKVSREMQKRRKIQ